MDKYPFKETFNWNSYQMFSQLLLGEIVQILKVLIT